MKVHKKWIILMAGMTVIAFAGLFATEPSFVCDFNKINGADVAWLITATIFVLMMTPGLSFFYGGMVGAKNVISTMLQSFIAMGLVSVLWVVFGFSLAFGNDIGGVLGDPTTFLMFQHVGADTYITPTGKLLGGATIPLALYALFQMKFAIITPSLITGSFAERVRFSAYLFFMMWFMVFIYCPLAHMTWHPDGLFLKWGVVDFAGGIVVHASSGGAALAGAIFLGRRAAQTRQSQPANIPFVLLGAAMLWLGWFGFNAGSSLHADGQAVKAFLNTNTASATAMMTWIFFDCLRGRKPSAMGAAVGCVVGLVAITPSAGYVTVGQSMQYRCLLAQPQPHRRCPRRVPHPRHGRYLRHSAHGHLHPGRPHLGHVGWRGGLPLPSACRGHRHRLYVCHELSGLLAYRQGHPHARECAERARGPRLLPARGTLWSVAYR